MPPSPVRIASVATAVPPYLLDQDEARDFGARFFRLGHGDRRLAIYRNAGIGTRYLSAPPDWYECDGRGLGDKNDKYVESALSLLEAAARSALADASLQPQDIDAIVTVSTTGIATPSLDARLMNVLPFRSDVERLPILGLGCAGGVLGLARAGAMASSRPGSRVLLLVVELCSLTFRSADRSTTNLVATALFGDGAAAAVIASEGPGPHIVGWGEHTWPETLDVMGWDVRNDGFGVVFARSIPAFARLHLRSAVLEFLEKQSLGMQRIDSFVCHPGGAKVLAAMEEVLEVPPERLRLSRDVLREYGNMSAATIFFVLARALSEAPSGRHLLISLGPGFSAGFALLDTP